MMVSPLKQILAKGRTEGRPQGLMPLLNQGEEMVWWRPLIIPFRPLVILLNLLLGSRGGGALPLGRSQSPRPVQTNEQVYEITWDESDRPVKVMVHRKVNEL